MRVLHLEPNSSDAETVHRLLRQEWPECVVVLVTDRDAYARSLAEGGFDLILSDFSSAPFDGLDALQLAKHRVPDTPLIFLSGYIGEDRALEAVRAGADDYVLKDRAKRLVMAIRRALRERAERQRLQSADAERQRLAATLENLPDFVGLTTPDGRVLYLNRAARSMARLPAGPLPGGLTLSSLQPPPVRERAARESLAAALRDGTWSGETLLLARDGHVFPVSQAIVAHRNATGQVEYLSIVMRDLSATKRALDLVHAQNQVLEMIAGGEPLDETLAALLRFIESQADDLLCCVRLVDQDGQWLRLAAAPRLPAEYAQAISRVPVGEGRGACGTSAFLRETVISSDIANDPRWTDYRELALAHGLRASWSTPILDVNHQLLGTFCVYRREPGEPAARHHRLVDVGVHVAAISISRFRAERRLQEQADILNKASDAIIVTDRENRITFWNHAAEQIFGWSAAEAIGRGEAEIFSAEGFAELGPARTAAAAGQEWQGELRLPDRSGQAHLMAARATVIRNESGEVAGRLAIATDISARKRIEEQFFRAQRLESIGMLAAGIAHDLNNVLAPILLAAPMLRDHATDPVDLRMIGTLEKSAERGAALVRQILGFAHGADGGHSVMQPKHLLRDIAGFIQETFPKSITLDDHIPSDLWPVKGNATQLHQVLLNLCVNARDAMTNGGTLTLRGENVVLDEAAAAEMDNAVAGAFVVCHVQDSGTGIPPEVLARMWDPFYTTKASGKGTGLGLSTVRGIVESHGGWVSVHTLVGRGTTFRVHFPAAEIPTDTTASGAPALVVSRGTGELVLVVDDEPGIRNMAAAILARHGYRVLTAADGAEAIALFAPRSKDIRVVITDLSMPNLDGAALAGVVQRINPAVRVVAVSGHGTASHEGPLAHSFADAFLVKPFRPEALLTAVHELLRAPPNPPP